MIQIVRTEIPDKVLKRSVRLVNLFNKLISVDPALWNDYASDYGVRKAVNALLSLRTDIPADEFAFAFPPCGPALRIHYTDSDGCHEVFSFVVSNIPVE